MGSRDPCPRPLRPLLTPQLAQLEWGCTAGASPLPCCLAFMASMASLHGPAPLPAVNGGGEEGKWRPHSELAQLGGPCNYERVLFFPSPTQPSDSCTQERVGGMEPSATWVSPACWLVGKQASSSGGGSAPPSLVPGAVDSCAAPSHGSWLQLSARLGTRGGRVGKQSLPLFSPSPEPAQWWGGMKQVALFPPQGS